MAMFTSGELEELQTCPYNVSHRITAKRFSVHLVRCRKANPNVKYVTCPFYAGHKVPEPELSYHMQHICDSRKELEKQLYQEQPTKKKWEVDRNIAIDNDETWEVSDRPSYNPQLYCEQNRVIRTIQVEPPSVRKQFRIAERERHQMLDRLDQDRLASSLKPNRHQFSETSEKEAGGTSTTASIGVYNQSDIEQPKLAWSKILTGREKLPDDIQDHSIIPVRVMSETSEREDATTSDVGSLTDALSDFSIEAPKSKEEKWEKVSTGRGRGRGRKNRK